MSSLSRIALAAALCVATMSTQAATFDLTLSGVVSDGASSSYDYNSTHFDQWSLGLSGLGSSNPITVGVGDTINATITFDSSFTIPASVDLTWVELSLHGSNFPAGDTATGNGTLAFFNGGTAGITATGGNCSSSGSFPICYTWSTPDNGSIMFDTVTMSFDIQELAGSTAPGPTATLDSTEFSYLLFSPAAPVPEPESYALILAGLGVVGVVARRRRLLLPSAA